MRAREPSPSTILDRLGPHPPRFARRPLPQGERDFARAARSSRDLPGGAVLGVFQHDAHFGELVADAVGFFEVLCLAGGVASLDRALSTVTLIRVTRRRIPNSACIRCRRASLLRSTNCRSVSRQASLALDVHAAADCAALGRRSEPRNSCKIMRQCAIARRIQIVGKRVERHRAQGQRFDRDRALTRQTSYQQSSVFRCASPDRLTVQSIGWR